MEIQIPNVTVSLSVDSNISQHFDDIHSIKKCILTLPIDHSNHSKYVDIINIINKQFQSYLLFENIYSHYQSSNTEYNTLNQLQNIQNDYNTQIIELKKDINKKIEYIDQLKKIHEDEMNIVHIKYNQQLSNFNGLLQEKIVNETKHLEEKFKLKESFYQETIQELRDKYQIFENIQQNNLEIMNLLQTPKMKSNTEIGNEGEKIVYNVLRSFTQYNPNAKIEDTSNIAMSGDIRFVYEKMICCIEVKHIREDIGHHHIEKFYRDIHIPNNRYNCGIFVSIRSGFTMKSGIEDMEIRIYNNKPIIYLAYTENNTDKIIMAIHVLRRLLLLLEESNNQHEIQQCIDQFRKQLSQIDTMSTYLKNMKDSIKAIEDTILQMKKDIHCSVNIDDLYPTKHHNPKLEEKISIKTVCGKVYKGITKNYKSHIAQCVQCKSAF